MTLRSTVFIAVAVALTGCAARYTIPDGAPTATITLTASDVPQGMTWLSTINGHACPQAEIVQLINHKHANHPHGQARIIAGKTALLRAEMISFATAGGCAVNGTFVPAEGGQYEAFFYAAKGVCALQLYRHENRARVVEPTFRQWGRMDERQLCSALP